MCQRPVVGFAGVNRRFQSLACHGRRWFAGFVFAESWVEVVLTLLGICYVIYRAIKLPLAPDEWGVLRSIYYHHFAGQFAARDWEDWNAQAQFLNLVLSRACFHLFRFNEIQRIRIPSVLSFGVFLYAIWRIRQQFTRRLVGRLAFFALLSNAFVLDYFSVSRGYGLAMAFATLSLAGLFEAGEGKSGWAFLAVWSAALAVVSNFSFLFLYLAILLIALFLLRRESIARLFWVASSALMLGAFYLPRLIVMERHNLLYFGGTSGFVSDTVVSLVKCMFYEGSPFYPFSSSRLEVALAWAVVGLVVGSAIGLFWSRDRRGLRICFCLLAMVAMILTGHSLLRVRFPIERAAMYFIPPFVLQIACLADRAPLRWLRLALSGLLLACSVAAAWGVNLTHMCISKVMADIPALVRDLTLSHERENKPVVLCVSDGTKWQVWYYAELATKTPETERLQDHGCFARIDWLYVYEPHCGGPTKEGRLSTPVTTDLFLSGDDYPPTWFLHDTVFMREYPVSHWRLYSKIEETVARDEDIQRMGPDLADGHLSLGNVLMQEGKVGGAIAQFEQALHIRPDLGQVHYDLGKALAQMGQVQKAIQEYHSALQIAPDFAEAHYSLGLLLEQAGQTPEAIAQYELAIRINPDYADAHNSLGATLAQLGRVQEAIGHWEQALRIQPDFAQVHNNLGHALTHMGRVPEAIPHLEQALRIDPGYAGAHVNLGIALARLGRMQEATGHWEQALRLNPDIAEAHFNLAVALEKTGRTREAIDHYQQALKLRPDSASARDALARLGVVQ